MHILFKLLERLEKNSYRIFSSFCSTEKKVDRNIILLYVLLLVLFFIKPFLTTYMHADFIAYWVPNYKFVLDSLHNGVLPFWQPYSFLGLPELFKLELVLFYPPVWILLFVNIVFNSSSDLTFIGKSIEILQYCNFLIGASGMYFLLKKIFKLSTISSFFGGAIFIFSIYITIQSGDISSLPGKLYLPLILLSLLNFINSGNFRNYLFLVFVNYLLLTLGYPYNYIYFYLAEMTLAVCFGFKKTLVVGISLINSILLAGFFLLPNLHILNQSARGAISGIEDPLFHLRNAYIPTKVINIFNPQVFANLYDVKDPHLLFSMGMLSWGVIPLIFLIIGFVNLKYNKLNIWTALLFIFGIVISLGGYIGAPETLGVIFPVIEKLRSHSQILSLTFFSGVIILAQGTDAVLHGYTNKKIFFFLWEIIILLIIYLLSLPFTCQICTSDSFDVIVSLFRSGLLLFIGLILVHMLSKSKNSVFLIACLIITLFEFSFYAQNISYLRMPISYSNYYKENSLIVEHSNLTNLFRYSFVENQFIYNTSMLGIFNKEGYETVPYQAYISLNRLSQEKILQFTNTKYLVTTTANQEKNIPSLSLIKTIDPKEHPQEIFLGTIKGFAYFSPQIENKYYIYKVNNYLPRFFISKHVQSCFGTGCLLNTDFSSLSYVNEGSIEQQNPPQHDVTIKIKSYTSNSIILSVETKIKTFISSSEIWDKGWKLSVNGNISKLYNVNNGFRGFFVPEGKSDIVMNYFPPFFYHGIVFSISGIIMLFGYLIYSVRYSIKDKHIKARHTIKK